MKQLIFVICGIFLIIFSTPHFAQANRNANGIKISFYTLIDMGHVVDKNTIDINNSEYTLKNCSSFRSSSKGLLHYTGNKKIKLTLGKNSLDLDVDSIEVTLENGACDFVDMRDISALRFTYIHPSGLAVTAKVKMHFYGSKLSGELTVLNTINVSNTVHYRAAYSYY